jgi:iron(III) transport system permease protein
MALLIEASSFKSFQEAVSKGVEALKNSVILSTFSSLVSVVSAFFAGYFHHKLEKLKKWLDVFYLAPFILPSVILALSFSVFWNKGFMRHITNFFYSTPLILMLFYVSICMPLATKAFSIYFDRLKRSQEEYALLITGNKFAFFIDLFMRPSLPLFIVSFAFFFMLNMRELSGTIILYPPGFETLSVRIFTLFHYGAPEVVASLSIMLIAILVFSYIILARCLKWWYWK